MGIPSYFSYIIKNYANIIRSLISFKRKNQTFTHLYMDCNSIIYDSYYEIEKKNKELSLDKEELEKELIANVITKIEEYVHYICPSTCLFIAFDGVAPFAKMQQQRTRRYKSSFMSNVSFDGNNSPSLWNRSAITPGTLFMDKLCNAVNYAFLHSEQKYNIEKVIVSCSDEQGEGEQKLFKHVRENVTNKDTLAVYGLDSDLIMLSIFHLKYTNHIFIFREAPEFLKSSIPIDTKDNEPYFVDINVLNLGLLQHMGCKYNTNHRIHDYVFLCFLLGNDFLPHFPSMNIRTHGIDTLLEIYRQHLGKSPDKYFIDPETSKIQWGNVNSFLKEVAKSEHQYLMEEYSVRDKYDHYKFAENTIEEKEKAFQNTPILYRKEEKYICPSEMGWENRYYKAIFGEERTSKLLKPLCNNYMEGLEWVYLYYTHDCPDWKWKYNYHYPPLFVDLVKYMPHFQTQFITPKYEPEEQIAFSPYTQLSYVLPRDNLDLIPNNKKEWLLKNYAKYYPLEYGFMWAYCRYFWEAHPLLPEMTLHIMEEIDNHMRSE